VECVEEAEMKLVMGGVRLAQAVDQRRRRQAGRRTKEAYLGVSGVRRRPPLVR
jgi:hypothetical protein